MKKTNYLLVFLGGVLLYIIFGSPSWQNIIYLLPGIVLGLTVHEFSHALTAKLLGDNTAAAMGRLTVNPIKHIDPLGFIFIVFANFGWARPVIFDLRNLRYPRRDKALIAAAGPVSNLLLALFSAGILKIWQILPQYVSSFNAVAFSLLYSDLSFHIVNAIYCGVKINLMLFFFNLLPIPPLDGCHILFSGLNLAPETETKMIRIGAPSLFALFMIQNYSGVTILPIGELISLIMGFMF